MTRNFKRFWRRCTRMNVIYSNKASSDKQFKFCNNGVKLCLSVLTVKIETVTEIWNLLTSQKTSCAFRRWRRSHFTSSWSRTSSFHKTGLFSNFPGWRSSDSHLAAKQRTNIVHQKSRRFSQSGVYSSRYRLNQLKRDADPGNVRKLSPL